MTHIQAKDYEKYPLIQPFEAENQDSLKEHIDNYLENLITLINTPVKECACCKGLGVIVDIIN